eukprot:6581426-Prymnesium_polylepis.1
MQVYVNAWSGKETGYARGCLASATLQSQTPRHTTHSQERVSSPPPPLSLVFTFTDVVPPYVAEI